ncbi:MAG: pullulanase-type alpha-1,6-glucosidase [Dermabacter sp.]|nr:pullulanase-type alpha-1,6-glucosidase [Dermabacter sp.]
MPRLLSHSTTATLPPVPTPLSRLIVAFVAVLALLMPMAGTLAPAAAEPPAVVTVPGSHNLAMGCGADWDPACEAAELTWNEDIGLFTGTWDLPAGNYEYKVAHDRSWDESYGKGGAPNGGDISYTHPGGSVTFVYDPVTHEVQNSSQGPLITLPGSFNKSLGCGGDWAPGCLATWMRDADGDGTYTFTTTKIAQGSHQVKVSESLNWDENYGEGGAPGGANYSFTAAEGKTVTFSYNSTTKLLTIEVEDPPAAGTGQLLAYWLEPALLAWPENLSAPAPGTTFELWNSPTASLALADGTVTGGEKVADLALGAPGDLPAEQLANKGHLKNYASLTATADGAPLTPERAADLLTGQAMVVQRDASGAVTVFTGVQIPGVLDSLYADKARTATVPRGVHADANGVSLNLWAPTAKNARLVLDAGTGAEQILPMQREADGSWTARGPRDWINRPYLYEVEVYAPAANGIVTNRVTDPYSVGLTLNSTASVIVDLDDPALAPDVWANSNAQHTENFAEQTIYELHVRDFSISDETVPENLRGTYAAFGERDSDGMRHLKELSDAGMTTVHLLPTFDIATIEEDRTKQRVPNIPADAARDSTAQQEAVNAVKDEDAFNWGYDPFHFSTPEGSYASDGNQEGGARTKEFRTMVGSLHEAGLGVVVDQVFNHTAEAGQNKRSVLDQVVPGYYHRLSTTGAVETSTCCQNVATEHAFAEDLMVDSIVTWARDYRVDGFRFDLMGHHSRANMERVRAELDALTLEKDGVDGSSIYLYGEGWNFGEVAGNARFTQATQGQLDGTGIGAFNDRLRDAVHGGGPFDEDKREGQGFGTGGFTDPNGVSGASPEARKADLLHRTDLIRLGLAGNLSGYTFETSQGTLQAGRDIDYNGQRAGYASQPYESVNYVDAHDNETLWDIGLWKLPEDTSVEERVRMNNLSLATVALGQSPSFWHAGTDMLRSKSMDRDSYNSGDHFNTLDFSKQTNNQGVGLPPAEKNKTDWPIVGPILANEALQPSPAQIDDSSQISLDLLKIRSSSPLFTLGSASSIQEKVTFPNGGPDATPGLLVMRIDDTAGADVDPALDGVVTVFNASPEAITESIEGLDGATYRLHSVQADGADPVVKGASLTAGEVSIPARTVAVFVLDQERPVEPTPEPTPDPNPDPTTDPPPHGDRDGKGDRNRKRQR